jgi:hypothetical protein
MAKAGIESIGEIQTAEGVSWQHFYSPDGTILEPIGPVPLSLNIPPATPTSKLAGPE